jgi:glyoxalase-like protein
MLRIDHVIYGVRDLDAAAGRLFEQFGLASAPGGKHEEWGTANAIVPLGDSDSYVELVAVIDAREAGRSSFGRWLETGVMQGERLMGWALATDDLESVASRLELTLAPGSRTRPDGSTISWRTAGLEKTLADQSLPFFITWDGPPDAHPARTQVQHRIAPLGIAWIEVVAPEVKLREWTEGADLPLRVVEQGAPRVRAVGISTTEGEIVLT